jgi:hypothetical protein
MQRLPLTQPPIGAPIRKESKDYENPKWCPKFCPNLSTLNIFSTSGFKVTVLTPGTWPTLWVHVILWVLTASFYIAFIHEGSFDGSEDWKGGQGTTWHEVMQLGAGLIVLSPVLILLHAQFVPNNNFGAWSWPGAMQFLSDLATTILAAVLIGGVGTTWKVTNYVMGQTGLKDSDYTWAAVIAFLHAFTVGHALLNGAQWIAANPREA